MPKKFSPELRDRAVRMVYDRHALEGGPRAQSIPFKRRWISFSVCTRDHFFFAAPVSRF